MYLPYKQLHYKHYYAGWVTLFQYQHYKHYYAGLKPLFQNQNHKHYDECKYICVSTSGVFYISDISGVQNWMNKLIKCEDDVSCILYLVK